jgi:hypothetical protein
MTTNRVLGSVRVCLRVLVVLTIMSCTAGFCWADSVDGAQSDPTVGPFTFINNTGVAVYDLETVWSGTGGLSNGVVTQNDGPGVATATASNNMVTVTWDDGGLANNGAVAFKMDAQVQAIFAGGMWTDINGAGIGPAVPTPEPGTIFLLGTALLALSSRLRSKQA